MMPRLPVWLVAYGVLACADTASAQGRVTSIAAVAERIGSPYPAEEDSRVAGWFYSGEPVRVVVTLHNSSRDTVHLDAQTEWSKAAGLVVRKAGPYVAGRPPAAGPEVEVGWKRVAMRPAEAAAPLSIGPGQSRPITLSLDGGAAALVPGVYTLQAMNGRQVGFLGIHAVETRADELNLAFHIATGLLSRQDYRAAREWLQKMLRLNPTSRPAFNLLGDAAAATGDCPGATTQWKKAAEIVSLDADPEAVPLSEWTRGDALRSLQRKIDNCK